MLMERAGTGGSLFRNLYRDFLKESSELLDSTELKEAYKDYSKIAGQWKMVSDLFYKGGETNEIQYIDKASDLLKEIAENEKKTMENLKEASA